MFSAVYISTSTQQFDGPQLEALLATSRAHNSELGLTGMLLYKEGRFLQALEGPEQQVRSVMSSIAADDRHDGIRILAEEQIDDRRFPDWSMGYPQINDGAAGTVPGYNDFLSHDHRTLPDSRSRAVMLLNWFHTH